METVRLGRTNIVVNRNGFGALPVQRVNMEEAKVILKKAYDNGITFFDSARAYSDSEEKIGRALSEVRQKIYISTKTMATTVTDFWKDLETSLSLLKTDYIDIYHLHWPDFHTSMESVMGKMEQALIHRAGKQLKLGVIMFSEGEILGKTGKVTEILEEIKREESR